MELDIKRVCKYYFIKIGSFYKANQSIKAKFEGKALKDYNLAIKLIDEKFLNAEQSVYLVYKENELIYAGYYSITFYDRWVRKQNDILYVWHGIEEKKEIKDNLINNPNIFSIWIIENPYIDNINISKTIEDIVIMEKQPILNRVQINLKEQRKNALKVTDIINNS